MAKNTEDISENFRTIHILNHCLPITYMQLYRGFLLIAEGPSLLIKNTKIAENPELQRYQIFTRIQTIQKIEVVETHCPAINYGFEKTLNSDIANILVWAGSILKIAYLDLKTGKLNVDANAICYEFDFLPIAVRCLDDGKQLAILSALNYLFLYEFDEHLKKYVRKNSYHGTRAHLYCGILSGTTLEDLLVFSGTAYREINVWAIAENLPKHLQTLKGHNGVALSLEYYPDVHTLISVSDDRSTIIWKFKSNSVLELQTQTKFFCPEARTWKSIIAGDVIASVGEGSVIAIHSLEGKLLKTWKGHHGASIYQCAFNIEGNTLYTGAYDGSISEWSNCLEQYQTKRLPLDVNCQGMEIMKIVGNDYPRSIVQYDLFNTIVAMNSGRILVCNPNRPDVLLFVSPSLCRYSVMALSPLKDMLLVGSLEGDLFNLQIKYGEGYDAYRSLIAEQDIYRPWLQTTKSAKKIVSILWIHPLRSVIATLDEVFVVEFKYESKVTTVYHHLLEDKKEITKEISKEIEVVCGKFIQKFSVDLTSPGISAALEVKSKYIILGNDDGNVDIFKYGEEKPVHEVKKAHRYGVTSITQWKSKIFTCGRNGIVRIYSLTFENDSEVLVECSNYTMPFEWVDQLYLRSQDLLVCGFSSTSFVIYCWNEKRVLTEIENCGGGHRSWDLYFTSSGLSVFSYIRDKEVYYSKLHLNELMGHTVKSGVHSKTINCATSIGDPESDIYFFASGSEDGTIRTFFWNKISRSIIMNNMFNNHISSVRTFNLLQDPKDKCGNTFFLFSGGGRSQIIAWKVRKYVENSSECSINSCAEIEMCGEQSLCDIPKKVKFSIDTRIMDISTAVIPSNNSGNSNGEIICFCACSDGYVRVLLYAPLKKRFSLIAIMSGIGHAVMRVHADYEFGLKYIFGVSSNGYLIIWKWNEELLDNNTSKISKKNFVIPTVEPIFKQEIQTSAIMSLNFFRQNSNEDIFIAIGTDDTTVAVFQIIKSLFGSDSFTCTQVWNKRCVKHRGAIVSVNSSSDASTVISCSNDQIISYWDFNGETKYESCFGGVTDCQGCVLLDDFLLCYGNGISFVSMPCKL